MIEPITKDDRNVPQLGPYPCSTSRRTSTIRPLHFKTLPSHRTSNVNVETSRKQTVTSSDECCSDSFDPSSRLLPRATRMRADPWWYCWTSHL